MPSSSKPRKLIQPANHRRLGRRFEEQAAAYYRSQGFELLDANWQAGHKEIDLVVRKSELVVFVEVKAAQSAAFGHPAEWVSKIKQRKLIAAAEQYLATHEVSGCDIRFDVICFVKGKIEPYPGAFAAEDDSRP